MDYKSNKRRQNILGVELRKQVNNIRLQKAREQRIEEEKLSVINWCKNAAAEGKDYTNLPILEEFCPTILEYGKLWEWLRSEGINASGWKTDQGHSYTLYW